MSSFHRADWLSLISPFVAAIVAVAGAYRVAYLSEKGKNRAAAEDLEKLTQIVEQIKADHQMQLAAIKQQNDLVTEQFKIRNQLRLAAIDKRLQAHQGAFRLWRLLYAKTHTDDIKSVVAKCVVWWEKNCLYLEVPARDAFSRAMWSANDHQMLLEMPGRDAAALEAIQRNWANIENAGNIIVDAAALPGLTEAEMEQLKRTAVDT